MKTEKGKRGDEWVLASNGKQKREEEKKNKQKTISFFKNEEKNQWVSYSSLICIGRK